MKSVLWVVEYRVPNGTWVPLGCTATYTRKSAREEMANRKTWKSYNNAPMRVAKWVRAVC